MLYAHLYLQFFDMLIYYLLGKEAKLPGAAVHTYNSSHLGTRDLEDSSTRPAWEKS
jgi:hypothetical protein